MFVRRPYFAPSDVVRKWLGKYFTIAFAFAKQGEPGGRGIQRDSDAEDGSVSQDGPDRQGSLGNQQSTDSGSANEDGSCGQASQTNNDHDAEMSVNSQEEAVSSPRSL